MGRKHAGPAALCFHLLLWQKLHVQRVILKRSTQVGSRSAIHSCIRFIGGGRAFAFAPALHHGRRTDIGAPPNPPAILAHAILSKIRVTRVQQYLPGARRTWFDLGAARSVGRFRFGFFMVPSLGEGASLSQAPLPFAL